MAKSIRNKQDHKHNELLNIVVHTATAEPSSGAKEAQIYYNSVSKKLFLRDNIKFNPIGTICDVSSSTRQLIASVDILRNVSISLEMSGAINSTDLGIPTAKQVYDFINSIGTGVTSISNGTGISVNKNTGEVIISNSDKGSTQLIFKNIVVDGEDTITANSNSASLKLVAGDGIIISTNNLTKEVTFQRVAGGEVFTELYYESGSEFGPIGILRGELAEIRFSPIPVASETESGVVTTVAQTFAGPKTFIEPISIPEGTEDNEGANLGQLKFQSDTPVVLASGKTLGKYTNGQTILSAGKTFEEVIKDIALEYLSPAFSSFSIIEQASIVEVGTTLSGSKTFTWSISNPTNVKPNTVSIFDNNTSSNLGSGLANDGSEVIALNGNTLNANNATQSWKIKAQNTKDEIFESGNIVVTAIYPIFYGKSNSQPTANQALIDGGTKAIVASTGTLNITFGASGQYLWFAHPALNPTKTKWHVNALNNGNIGSISDLFNAPTTVSITTVMWAGVSYKVYISNIPTTTSGNMELKNS